MGEITRLLWGLYFLRHNKKAEALPQLFCGPLLLGVQFDDVGFVDFVFVREFISLRESGQGCSPVIEGFFDIREIEGFHFLERLFEHFIGSVSILQGNHLACANRVRWNIYSLAINGNQAMGNHLTSLTDGACKACTVYKVVQSAVFSDERLLPAVLTLSDGRIRLRRNVCLS